MTLVPQPQDIQVRLVAAHQLIVAEGPKPLRLLALLPVLGVVAGDEVPEGLRAQGCSA